jgi:hypothetical protein
MDLFMISLSIIYFIILVFELRSRAVIYDYDYLFNANDSESVDAALHQMGFPDLASLFLGKAITS